MAMIERSFGATRERYINSQEPSAPQSEHQRGQRSDGVGRQGSMHSSRLTATRGVSSRLPAATALPLVARTVPVCLPPSSLAACVCQLAPQPAKERATYPTRLCLSKRLSPRIENMVKPHGEENVQLKMRKDAMHGENVAVISHPVPSLYVHPF